MIGYEFKQDGVTRKIQLKTANKRAKTSWIWRHGFECRRKDLAPIHRNQTSCVGSVGSNDVEVISIEVMKISNR